VKIERIYTTPGVHPYDEVTWEKRDVVQQNWKTGETIFDQRGVEFPDFWSVNASTIVTTKYFRGAVGTPERETGLKQLIDRVVLTYVKAGKDHGYFGTDEDAEIFEHELTYALLHQVFSFNSPVWFNVGTKSPQQVSACFILSIDDSMDSILNWYKEEGFIFKGGSGAGLNLSRIRSSKELLSSGGTASGPVSFMRGADASAGTIKSGGATRRAAKMVVLDVDPRSGGDRALARLEEHWGPLPPTPETRTGGGGRHLWLARPSAALASVVLAPGLEVKAEAGAVVAPPSLHASGRHYRWAADRSPWDLAPAPAPDWLVALAAGTEGGPQRRHPLRDPPPRTETERRAFAEAWGEAGIDLLSGDRYYLCPFHDDHHPSLHIDADGCRWFCFGCRRGGGIGALRRARDGRPPARPGRRRAEVPEEDRSVTLAGDAEVDVVGESHHQDELLAPHRRSAPLRRCQRADGGRARTGAREPLRRRRGRGAHRRAAGRLSAARRRGAPAAAGRPEHRSARAGHVPGHDPRRLGPGARRRGCLRCGSAAATDGPLSAPRCDRGMGSRLSA